MKNTIISWIGATDLRAPKEYKTIGLGPIGQAIIEEQYDSIVLICDYPADKVQVFIEWLRSKTTADVKVFFVTLSGPTDFGDIYREVTNILKNLTVKNEFPTAFTYHLSPGTPAMAAVWIILAKTQYPARLIESSKDHGVRTVSFPFDIAADFLPNLLQESASKLKLLAAGLPENGSVFDDIIHRSTVMQKVVIKARLVAPYTVPVLIEGESGTGKELFARAIHKGSLRSEQPFIVINCGAIPAELVESELFGHEKGAFTGAVTYRKGLFQAADGGTLFLDEIGELPKDIQVKLLRVLQENEIRAVGATQSKTIDVRIIAATNRNLADDVTNGLFREDLFYRLAVAILRLPSLKDREGDLNLLIDKLLDRVNKTIAVPFGGKHKYISVSARNIMLQHHWPGNIRELLNTLTRASVWSPGEIIDSEDVQEALLPMNIQPVTDTGFMNFDVKEGIDLQNILDNVAIQYLKKGLEETRGNKTKTAELLGLSSYQTLNNWLKRYNLE